jgi:WD40 repeat protein
MLMNNPTLTKKHEFKLPTGVLAAALAPDGDSLVAGCMDGVYRLRFDPHEHKKLFSHDSYVSSTAWLADDQLLSAGYDGTIAWFDPASNECTRKVRLHDFWSWDMAVSPDEKLLASVTGQYLAGGYKYEPQQEREPSLKIVSVESGETLHSLPHVPSVQAVAFSPDSRLVAAGNLMGEVRLFDVTDGQLVANFTTPDFTSWGIIKSHCYLGGIFAIEFTPDGKELLLAGMGPMRDPMAGNGRQLWQKWSWQDAEAKMVDQTHKGESGEGLMETLAVHPSGQYFAMGGRLRGGDWNVALFDLESGNRVATLKTGYRVTEARYNADGSQLILAGAQGQPSKKKEGRFGDFGRVDVYDVQTES